MISQSNLKNNNGFAVFAKMIFSLGKATKTNHKVRILTEYFSSSGNERDKVWVVALFSGRKPKRIVNSTLLSQWAIEVSNVPEWLYKECYHSVGDLAETISLILPVKDEEDSLMNTSLSDLMHTFGELTLQDIDIKKEFILSSWAQMNQKEIFVFNKLITGAFRIGVSQKLVVNALTKITQLEASLITHQISGKWNASNISLEELLSNKAIADDCSKPYPFCLAHTLRNPPEELGNCDEWQAEWKWDGIRGQVIKRSGEFFIWSRGEELLTDRFPELMALKDILPEGVVIDGEIMPFLPDYTIRQEEIGFKNNTVFEAGLVLPFAMLQTRITRKIISKKQLQEAPVAFFAYDLLEFNGEDCRPWPLWKRRHQLTALINQNHKSRIYISPELQFTTWSDLTLQREHSREKGAEGLMIKRKNSAYHVGRKVGDWWKWKMDPFVIDAVLIYAEKGSGIRSNLYTAYTFAVRDGDKLVSFARAYSGLSNDEIRQVDSFVKKNSIEKFGPVRTVKPELVFEIAFEGIDVSKRHKSGVAVRFPRIKKWRKDKRVEEINTLEDLQDLLKNFG